MNVSRITNRVFSSIKNPLLPSEKQFRNKTLMRKVLRSHKAQFLNGVRLSVDNVNPKKFASTNFEFVEDDGTRRAFTGKRLLQEYGFKSKLTDIAVLFDVLGLEPAGDIDVKGVSVLEIKEEFVRAVVKLGKLPTQIDVFDLKEAILLRGGSASLDGILGLYLRKNESWPDGLARMIIELNFSENELRDIQTEIDARKMQKTSSIRST
jgi:hypothetical protein